MFAGVALQHTAMLCSVADCGVVRYLGYWEECHGVQSKSPGTSTQHTKIQTCVNALIMICPSTLPPCPSQLWNYVCACRHQGGSTRTAWLLTGKKLCLGNRDQLHWHYEVKTIPQYFMMASNFLQMVLPQREGRRDEGREIPYYGTIHDGGDTRAKIPRNITTP